MEKVLQEILMYIKECDFSLALEKITEHEHLYGNDSAFIKVKAILCVEVGEYQTALRLLKQAQVINPSDGEIYYYLVQVYEKLSENTMRCDAAEEVIVINSDDKCPAEYTEDLNLYKNRAAMQNFLIAADAPLVSIVFVAYNNLEKLTKPAIECLLKYTQGIDYELILLDNGSTDETLAYFMHIPYQRKKIIRVTKNVGAFYGQYKAFPHCKGKYIAILPNDILVTKNWLKNMLICAESDERIGLVTPLTDNCSNQQSVNLGYKDFEDMQEKAALFNQSNPKTWHERIRLMPILPLIRREAWQLYHADHAFIYNFADDDLSFQYRHQGYKLILCGDVFVHHEGSSVVGKNKEKYREDLVKGREIFRRKYHGVDAWEDVNNYESHLFDVFPFERVAIKSGVRILGIDVRCGTPILELKNKLKVIGIDNATLSVFFRDAKYWQDLKSICEGEVLCDRIAYFPEAVANNLFDYVMLGEPINSYENPYWLLRVIADKLLMNGLMTIKVKNLFNIEYFVELEKNTQKENSVSKINIEEFEKTLNDNHCKILKKAAVIYKAITESDKAAVIERVRSMIGSENREEIINDLFVMEYIFVIEKVG